MKSVEGCVSPHNFLPASSTAFSLQLARPSTSFYPHPPYSVSRLQCPPLTPAFSLSYEFGRKALVLLLIFPLNLSLLYWL